MATIKKGTHEVEVKDDSSIKEACMKLDVPFGCQSGICGACKIEILDGEDNLNELTEEENNMGDCDRKHRLACQAKIKSGKVIIKPVE